jgi:cofilin
MSGAVSSTTGDSSLCITVPPEISTLFKDLKTRRKYAWLMLSINMDTFSLEVKKTGLPGPKQLQELLSSLPPAAGCFIVYDLPVKNTYGGLGSSLKFITWAPTSAPGKTTVAYAQQRRSLDTVFTGVIDSLATTRSDIEGLLGGGDKGDKDDGEWDPDA